MHRGQHPRRAPPGLSRVVRPVEWPAAGGADPERRAEDGAAGGGPQHHDPGWTNHLQLGDQPWPTGCDVDPAGTLVDALAGPARIEPEVLDRVRPVDLRGVDARL